MTLINKTIEYTYDGADSYRVEFTQADDQIFAHWHCLTGDHAGDNRKETADIEEVTENVFFVTWLEPTQEMVSFVLNLDNDTITCSYYYGGERHWWKGAVTDITPLSI